MTKVIHSTRKHASERVQGLEAVVHKLLTVYTQAKKILTIYPQIYPHPPFARARTGTLYISIEQKFYYFLR